MKRTNSGPVFIVGMNGSGTTMLADCLNNHPELYVFPDESKVLPYYLSKLESYGDLSQLSARHKFAADIGKCWPFWEVNNRKRVFLNDEMLVEPGLGGVLNGLYGYFASLEGKERCRWGDKTPMYVQHMVLLANYLPDAQFIHIYRDGRDVAQSVHRRFSGDPRHTIYRWKKIVKNGMEQGKQLGLSRYLQLSYEELTSEAEKYMRKICLFLDMPFNSDVLISSMPYQVTFDLHSRSNKYKGNIIRNSEKWRSYFTSKQVAELEHISGKMLSQLGYNISTANGDHNPSEGLLRYWKIRHNLKKTLQFFKTRGIAASGRYLKRAVIAIIQDRSQLY